MPATIFALGLDSISDYTFRKLWTGKLLNKHKLFGHVYMVFLIPLTWTVFAVNDITQLGFLFTRLFPFFGKVHGRFLGMTT